MSQYKTIETKFKTLASLLEALEDLGYSESMVQVAPNPQVPSLKMERFLGGYHDQKVSVRLPIRSQRGAFEDVGFYWDGVAYQAIVSTHDGDPNFGTQKLMQLKQRYALSETKRIARTKGYTVQETRQPDGTIRLALHHR